VETSRDHGTAHRVAIRRDELTHRPNPSFGGSRGEPNEDLLADDKHIAAVDRMGCFDPDTVTMCCQRRSGRIHLGLTRSGAWPGDHRHLVEHDSGVLHEH
jgi:hypothetical protein